MDPAELLQYLPETIFATYKYVRSIYDQRKEADKSFKDNLEFLTEQNQTRKDLYHLLENDSEE